VLLSGGKNKMKKVMILTTVALVILASGVIGVVVFRPQHKMSRDFLVVGRRSVAMIDRYKKDRILGDDLHRASQAAELIREVEVTGYHTALLFNAEGRLVKLTHESASLPRRGWSRVRTVARPSTKASPLLILLRCWTPACKYRISWMRATSLWQCQPYRQSMTIPSI